MALELFISRRAARQIDRLAQWWSLNRPSAPGAVRMDLEAAFSLLLEQPGIGGAVPQASSIDVRRFHVDRIRYWGLLPRARQTPGGGLGLAFEPRLRSSGITA